jgi:hypothetical protein
MQDSRRLTGDGVRETGEMLFGVHDGDPPLAVEGHAAALRSKVGMVFVVKGAARCWLSWVLLYNFSSGFLKTEFANLGLQFCKEEVEDGFHFVKAERMEGWKVRTE